MSEDIQPSCLIWGSAYNSILIESPLAGKTSWENDLSIAPMGSSRSIFDQLWFYHFFQLWLPLGMEQFVDLLHGNMTYSGSATLIQFMVHNIMPGQSSSGFLTFDLSLQRMFYYHLVTSNFVTKQMF